MHLSENAVRYPCAARSGQSPLAHGPSTVRYCEADVSRVGVAGRNGPLRFSLACLGFSFLFRGVQRGYFSFQRERSEIMKADELLISAKELP